MKTLDTCRVLLSERRFKPVYIILMYLEYNICELEKII